MEKLVLVRTRKNSKIPDGRRWHAGNWDEAQDWIKHGYNVSLWTDRSGIMGLDYDDLALARADYPKWGEYCSVLYRTRRGVHALFKHDGGEKSQHFKGLDIKRTGLLVFPKSTVDGVQYSFLREDWENLQDAPPIITPEKIRKEVYEEIDIARRITRARAYLARVEGAVSGQHGHNKTMYAAACLVQKFDLPVDVAFPLLLEWNCKCEPPWSEMDLYRKLQEAERLK